MPPTFSPSLTGIQASQFDPASVAFLAAAGITDNLQKYALNNLVTDLKLANLFTRFNCIYPFLGGTATTHKYNLKNPQDTNGAQRLNFIGGWTHASTGATPNGTNAFADTFFVPGTMGNNNNTCIFTYLRTNNGGQFSVDLGVQTSGTSRWLIIPRWTTDQFFGDLPDVGTRVTASMVAVPPTGLFSLNRSGGQSLKAFKDGSQIGPTSTNFELGNYPFRPVLISGQQNDAGDAVVNFSARETAFVGIGTSLNDAEQAAIYTIIQRYQTALSRQI